jgi:Uncharacterized protein conserved in bacteria (DUF2188)
MAKLPRYTLSHDDKKERWILVNSETNRTKAAFDTKAEATKGGVLEGALGRAGGSVKIRKLNGRVQEERTFPGSKDPRSSKG